MWAQPIDLNRDDILNVFQPKADKLLDIVEKGIKLDKNKRFERECRWGSWVTIKDFGKSVVVSICICQTQVLESACLFHIRPKGVVHHMWTCWWRNGPFKVMCVTTINIKVFDGEIRMSKGVSHAHIFRGWREILFRWMQSTFMTVGMQLNVDR